jgi:2-octaprenyl-6-methoxyphenol hydroxylase
MGQSSERSDIVIAGAGIAGLALAVALGRALKPKFSITVCDSALAREPAADDRVSAITTGTRHLLEMLGVWNSIARRAQPIHEMEITDSRIEDAVRPTFLNFEEDNTPEEPLAFMVEHRELAIVLREGTVDAGVRFLSEEIEGFETANSGLNVLLTNRISLNTNLLVAADGARSKLRSLAGISSVSWPYEQSGIVVTIGHERDHEGRAVQHFLPAGPFAILPLTGRRSSIVWTETTKEANRIVALTPQDFKKELSLRVGQKLGKIELLSPARAYPLSFAMARHFAGDRLALVGDAAHVIHPLAGQGLNLGLRDVAALAECITDAARLGLDHGSSDVLKRYERWRRPDTVAMASITDGLNRLFSNQSDALRVVRDVGLGIVGRLPTLKNYFSREAAGTSGELPRLLRGDVL